MDHLLFKTCLTDEAAIGVHMSACAALIPALAFRHCTLIVCQPCEESAIRICGGTRRGRAKSAARVLECKENSFGGTYKPQTRQMCAGTDLDGTINSSCTIKMFTCMHRTRRGYPMVPCPRCCTY